VIYRQIMDDGAPQTNTVHVSDVSSAVDVTLRCVGCVNASISTARFNTSCGSRKARNLYRTIPIIAVPVLQGRPSPLGSYTQSPHPLPSSPVLSPSPLQSLPFPPLPPPPLLTGVRGITPGKILAITDAWR
jgi:hypothetical protein